MKIHGAVYVILGILMSLYAKFIQSKVEKSSLVVFFWIGIGFVVFGVFRLIISFVFKDKKKKDNIKKNKYDDMKKNNHNKSDFERLKQEKDKLMNDFSKKSAYNDEIVVCPRCGTRHYSNSNFCHMCGYSLK